MEPVPTTGGAFRRALTVLVWALAAAIVLGYALLAARAGGGTPGTPRFIGFVIGALVAPVVIAAVLRFSLLVARDRRRPAVRAVLGSTWLPATAIVIAGLALVGNLGSLRPIDPQSAIRIGGPFSLRPASAETLQIAEAGFKGDRTIGAYEVREVVGDDGSLSLMVVAEGPLQDRVGAIEAVGRGIESASGLTATYETIRDRQVAIVVGETLSIGAWIEQPLGIYVYAVTPSRLHQIIEAILDAPKAGPLTGSVARSARERPPDARPGDDRADQGTDREPAQELGQVTVVGAHGCRSGLGPSVATMLTIPIPSQARIEAPMRL
jgi:hypothetical protein